MVWSRVRKRKRSHYFDDFVAGARIARLHGGIAHEVMPRAADLKRPDADLARDYYMRSEIVAKRLGLALAPKQHGAAGRTRGRRREVRAFVRRARLKRMPT
jgi:hypothetical protein